MLEEGYPDYNMLDPVLRPRPWENDDGTQMRRIRKRATVHLLDANVEFVRRHVLPSNPKKYRGHLTRGIHDCVDYWLEKLQGDIPEVPPRDSNDEFQYTALTITLLPETADAVNAIVEYWQGTNLQCLRSQVIDYFISLTRQGVELRVKA